MRRLAQQARRAASTVSPRRARALAALGCDATSSRASIRDAFYARAKAVHPDAGGPAEAFRALAEAYECATRDERAAAAVPAADDAHEADAAADPLAVYLRVEAERAAAVRRELAAAARLAAGGLDKGGLWMLAAQMADEGARAPPPPPPPPPAPREGT